MILPTQSSSFLHNLADISAIGSGPLGGNHVARRDSASRPMGSDKKKVPYQDRRSFIDYILERTPPSGIVASIRCGYCSMIAIRPLIREGPTFWSALPRCAMGS